MRKLKTEEHDLIVFLLKDKPDAKHIIDSLSNAMVEEMNDGGMGSLKFVSNQEDNRAFNKEIAEISLLDTDGIPVSFTINVDTNGAIYELDVFKADFSSLKQFPSQPYKYA